MAMVSRFLLWGDRRQWPWHELAGFDATKTSILGRKVLRFAVPDAVDWSARLRLRPGIHISSGNLIVLIGDIYDAPLDEIIAQLNVYRDAALSVG